MSAYTTKELESILKLHQKWINNEIGGVRANLSGANMTDANLSGADLSDANLYGANLYGANLTYQAQTYQTQYEDIEKK